jgi:DNA-directed RNA polymerase subunit beta'
MIQKKKETNILSENDKVSKKDTQIFLKSSQAFTHTEKPFFGMELTFISSQERERQLSRLLNNGSVIGEVTEFHTLNYRTLKPEKNGLFCERIFGPTQNYICACGKRRNKKNENLYCPECEVDYTSSTVRRYRLGFIRLVLPMSHLWFLRGRPSYISILLDIKKKHAELIHTGQGLICNSFQPKFSERIQKSRFTFNQNFLNFRKKTLKEATSLREINLKDLTTLGQQPKTRPPMQTNIFDDFWVVPKPKRFKKFSSFYVNTRSYSFLRTKTWHKRLFQEQKPFYNVPLMKDNFVGLESRPSFESRTVAEDPPRFYDPGIIRIYLFQPDKPYTPLVLRKHQRAVANSNLTLLESNLNYHPRKNRITSMTGGSAFIHLFSKIDQYRLANSLFRRIRKTNKQLDSYYLYFERTKTYPERIDFIEMNKLKRKIAKNMRRCQFFRFFATKGFRPEWLFFSILPVLPPALRPILKLQSGQLAISDLNRLYQLVINRNQILTANISFVHNVAYGHAFGDDWAREVKCLGIAKRADKFDYDYLYKFTFYQITWAQYLVQEAIDALFDNKPTPIHQTYMMNLQSRTKLKSLSDILKGKKGRFRQNLLGKRVDYSGRSVISVGPTLKVFQCGLPKEMALELFQALLMQKLVRLNLATSMMDAKMFIERGHPIIWPILNEMMIHYPILLNRAPTLHRLGVQAFLPKLVRGKALLLHPLVCPAFNADFDGDQMGVHIPLTLEAKAEAWSLMLASQNIVSPATGEPIMIPSQDMVLGSYYLTTIDDKKKPKKTRSFANLLDVYQTYLNQNLHVHDWVWLKWKKTFESSQKEIRPLEIRINRQAESLLITKNSHQIFNVKTSMFSSYRILLWNQITSQYIRTTIGRVIFNYEMMFELKKSSSEPNQ